MKKPTVALAMIVKNEAENLPRIFESVKGCVEGIFITDTGSTDNTVEVAESLGAKVSHFKWIDDFSAARNFSFEQVTDDFDFILWLDGDDVLDNPEGFKLFKENVMSLADYHMAPYHYALDADGNPSCTFIRERVFRRSKQFQWKYFVHEGIIPTSGLGEIRINYTGSWAIKHLRTDADLLKDRKRNLNLFTPHLDNLDARMTYYYGKELFENEEAQRSIGHLHKAIGSKDLEPHDRVLAMQYLGLAYMKTEQYQRAIDISLSGVQLAPNRAELYVIIGDAFIKLNKFQDAVPFYSAAKSCSTGLPQGGAAPIFHHVASYGEFPSVQLCRIYANLGNIDKAIEEARYAFIHYKSKEGEALLEELKKMVNMSMEYKNAKPCDDIVITTPPQNAYEWDPIKAKEKAMGGSETAAIEMAHHLHKLSGRPVKVFNMREKDIEVDGVEYVSTAKLVDYMGKNKPYIHIAWRHNIKITDAPTFVWSHDLMTPGAEIHNQYDRILALTPFHKRYLMANQNIPEDKILVTRNGIDPSRFKENMFVKDPFRFVFGSSPDRGLDRCMLVLDKVREKYPLIKLHIHYGIEHLPKWGHQALHDKLKKMIADRNSWVVYHGATQQNELMNSYKSSAYLVQPSSFIETSCISAMELLACGVYPIFRRVGGVADTLSKAEQIGMAKLVDSDCITEEEFTLYVNATIEALDQEAYKRVSINVEELSWEKVAKEWLQKLPELSLVRENQKDQIT